MTIERKTNGEPRRFERKVIEFEGKGVSYIEKGEGAPNTIVMLPGWPADCQMFENLMNALDENEFNSVAVDHPGWGMSKTLGRYDFDSMSSNLVGFCEAKFGERKVRLLGVSYGASLGLYTAATYPENIGEVIACSPAIRFRDSMQGWQQGVFALSYLPGARRIAYNKLINGDHEVLNYFFEDTNMGNSKIKDLFERTRSFPPDFRAMSSLVNQIVTSDLSEVLTNVKSETLLLVGDVDTDFIKQTVTAHRKIPRNTMHIIESDDLRRIKADHISIVTMPDKYAREVSGFLLKKSG